MNAKNDFGGYSGYTPFIYHEPSKSVVLARDNDGAFKVNQSCTQQKSAEVNEELQARWQRLQSLIARIRHLRHTERIKRSDKRSRASEGKLIVTSTALHPTPAPMAVLDWINGRPAPGTMGELTGALALHSQDGSSNPGR